MRILYGVVGEGMGHATRSRVVVDRLLEQGHEVVIMVSGRAADVLAQRFSGTRRIHGFHVVYENATVKTVRTAVSNLLGLRDGLPQNVAAYFDLVESFRPDVVISDFESWTYLYAKAHRLPVVSIDNMQAINRCELDADVLAAKRTEFLLAKGIVKAKLPGAFHYIVTSFFRPPLRKERTTLVPPIVRPEVLDARAGVSRGDHILVYLSGGAADGLEAVLASRPEVPFVVYGLRTGLDHVVEAGHIQHQPFSETRFIEHLASARAVIAGGGFSLMTEAIALGKPMLAVPLRGQFEQYLNARYLEQLGLGMCCEAVTPSAIDDLLEREPQFRARLAPYVQHDNEALFATLDEVLARATDPDADFSTEEGVQA